MNPDAKAILNTMISSTVGAELLILFHGNPGVVDTIEGVARRIGRRGTEVEPTLRDLIRLGTVRVQKIGNHEVVSLDKSRDTEIQAVLLRYFQDLGK